VLVHSSFQRRDGFVVEELHEGMVEQLFGARSRLGVFLQTLGDEISKIGAESPVLR